MSGLKEKVPKDILDKDRFFRDRADEVIELLFSRYEMTALDYINLMDFIKNQGLARFQL